MDSIHEKLEAVLQNGIKAGIPGLTAAISNSNGIIWESQAGESDIQTHNAMSKSHLFGVGSITKVFVTVAALQLVEENVLKMTDTAGSILGTSVIDGIPNAATATLSDLTSHTSGIPDWEEDPKWIREGEGIDAVPSRIWEKLDTLEYIRKSSKEKHLPDHQTTKFPFSYASANFTLVGLMIEKVTGNTAESEIRQRILEPLGLISTYFEGFESLPRRFFLWGFLNLFLYRPQLDILPHRYHYASPIFRETAGLSPYFPEVRSGLIDASSSNLSMYWTAGGIISSPQDVCKFALALKNGKLLKKEGMEILQDWTPIGPDIDMGHGIFRMKKEGGYVCGHSGSTLGFTGSFIWIEDADIVLAVGANVGTMHVGTGEDLQGAANILMKLLDLTFEFLQHS